jgi:hypothetical protein
VDVVEPGEHRCDERTPLHVEALGISHLTVDRHPVAMAALARSVPPSARYRLAIRSRGEVARFFGGLAMVPPGLVPVDRWRPDEAPASERASATSAGSAASRDA